MKKRTILFFAAALCLTLGACGKPSNNNGNQKNPEVQEEAKDAVEVLKNVWDAYQEDERFSAIGGDFNHTVEEAPGKFDITDTESLQYVLYLPSDSIELVDDAASLVHMMNANTFTGSAFHVKDGDVEKLSSSLKDNIMNTQWMCGFPDILMMAKVDDYLVTVFGNEELVTTFKTRLLEAYNNAEILCEENLMF